MVPQKNYVRNKKNYYYRYFSINRVFFELKLYYAIWDLRIFITQKKKNCKLIKKYPDINKSILKK